MATLHGIVLAAGAGTRMGRAKALMRHPDGTPWLAEACAMLTSAGSSSVTVVLGSSSDEARGLVPPGVHVVVARDWASGMAASLRAGLDAAAASDADAALITLVDLPGLPASVGLRVSADVEGVDARAVLRQAVFGGRPGHPVLIGRDHWAALASELSGDRGARPYLARHGVFEVECGDLATGDDVDRPQTDDGPGIQNRPETDDGPGTP